MASGFSSNKSKVKRVGGNSNSKEESKKKKNFKRLKSGVGGGVTEEEGEVENWQNFEGDMQGGGVGGGGGFMRAESRVSISLAYKTKKERRELRRRLEGELSLVRSMVKRLEFCGGNVRGNGGGGNGGAGKLKRVNSEVGSVGWHDGSRVGEQMNVVVPAHSVSDNVVEKDKRTPKANQYYQNPDFVSGKEKMVSLEQSKKSKGLGKKNAESGSKPGMGSSVGKIFKDCGLLLEKLMKHKHGWVFNNPVDVKGLGLHDYFTIIKHPMDLGTVKTRLNSNWYKSPKEFAEDVRLTFQNAMTYNPKGYDVHIMAEMLLKIFEEKWPSIEEEYIREFRAPDYESGLPTPTSKKAPPHPTPQPPPIDTPRPLERSESMTNPVSAKSKTMSSTPLGRIPLPKKPKARDPHKRNMTYMEKQKLSTELQNLPSEKLDNVVQIIRKRNPSLCQNDDEIEVDIDSVDTETLWELDRFVINFKKNQSKVKRLPQEKGDTDADGPEKHEAASVMEEPKESRTGVEEKNDLSAAAIQLEKQGGNATKSVSSRSSSSDSGSSSSDSDSDTSST